MSNGFYSLIEKLSGGANTASTEQRKQRLQTVKTYLNELPEIRVLVSDSPNFDCISSSVQILRNLIRLVSGNSTSFTLVLQATHGGSDFQALAEKLKYLIPQFKLDGNFTLDGKSVKSVRLSPNPGLSSLELGITGGFEDAQDQLPLVELNVTNFIQLQPYASKKGKNIIITKENGSAKTVDLDNEFRELILNKRAYLVPEPKIDDAGKEQWKIAEYLINRLPNIHLAPVTGLTDLESAKAATILMNYVAGVIEAQDSLSAAKKPTVLVLVSELADGDEVFAKNIHTQEQYFDLLANNPAKPDDDFFKWPRALRRPNQHYQAWHQQHGVQGRIKFEKNAKLGTIKSFVEQSLKNNGVYIIALGQAPDFVRSQLYQKATLPPLLNAAGAVERMLNIGRPFLKIHDNSAEAKFAYPSLPLDRKSSEPLAARCLKDSYQGLFAQQPGNWPRKTEPLFPPQLLLEFFKAYLATQQDQHALNPYFQRLRSFFHDELNDKLLAGLDILVNNLKEKPQEEENLEELEDALNESTDEEGKIDFKQFMEENASKLLKSDLLKNFLSSVIGEDGFEIAGVTIKLDSNVPSLTLQGNSAAFGVGSMQLGFVFSVDEKNSVNTDFSASMSEAKLTMPGAEWLSAGAPALALTFRPNNPTPVTGAIALTLTSGTTVDMLLRVPSAPETLLLQGNFAQNRPGFTNLFQMTGGLNLANILPEQLQLLADIEVRDFELHYNYQLHKMELIGVNVALPDGKEWGLVPAVKATGLNINLLVENASSLDRSLRGSVYGLFGIGEATGFLSANVPDLYVAGGLEKDSKPLTLDALIKAYLGDLPVPATIGNTAISGLLFQADKANRAYSFGVGIDANWAIEIDNKTLFNIQNLGFFIEGKTTSIGASANGATKKEISGLFNGNVQLLSGSPGALDLSISAAYQTGAGWIFAAQQASDAISISDMLREYLGWQTDLQINLDRLGLRIETETNSFEFTAQTTWEIPIEADNGVNLTGNIAFGSRKTNPQLSREFYGAISAEVQWRNIDMTVFYNFDPKVKQYGIQWWKLVGVLNIKDLPNGQKQKTAILKFIESTSIGEMIETMIGWATGSNFGLGAPWDLLNKITLDNLSLTYDFTAGSVSFNVAIGPIELGFARITSIGVAYHSDKNNPANNGVLVNLEGTFFWQTDDPQKPISWDAARPETTPAPPGGGSKYLDLRLLALGQHVTLPCFATADTVQKAIACMVNMPDPEPGKLPAITFDPKSNWLIGADFGILKLDQETAAEGGVQRVKQNYFLSLQIVFNDPYLYGLRIALEGKPAKVFAGLDFQVMYRQISDSVGVYQAEIQLPDIMRRLTVGAYTITLPIFGIAIYTNGDFQIDLGFPWNHDFTRSFGVEAIIPPGIPVVGAAGLYFGKLSSGTTNKVPAAINGTFNPVIVFGFGAQIGVGKSFEAGIFRAGISLTIVGIIEGVIAKWNPYQIAVAQDSNSQVQGEYYFWLQGTFGIMGRLYGTIDFAIIRADVNVTLALFAQITFATYEPIIFSVIASVEVRVAVRINLGLFKITIHFSFAMKVKQTFTLDNTGTPPWQVERAGARTRGVLLSPTARRLVTARSLTFTGRSIVSEFKRPKWENLQFSRNRVELDGYLTVALTVAKDEFPDSDQQFVCGVASLFIDTVAPNGNLENREEVPATDSSFEKLAKQVFRWIIAAAHSGLIHSSEVDKLVITSELLKEMEAYLNNTRENPEPIPPEAIDQFITGQISLTIRDRSGEANETEVPATYFPIPLHLKLTIPDYDDSKGVSYNFGEYNSISDTFLDDLRAHFDQLAAHVEEPLEEDEPLVFGRGLTGSTKSVANYVRSDYFLLIARQMVQSAQRTLRNLKYEITDNRTVDEILQWVDENGSLNGAFDRFDLFASNGRHLLQPNKKIRIGTFTDYFVKPEESFSDIGKMDFDHELSALDIIVANANRKDILMPNRRVGMGGRGLYITTGRESLLDIATHFKVSLNQLLRQTKLSDLRVYLLPPASLDIPLFAGYNLQEGDSFDDIAKIVYQDAFTGEQLAQQNQYYPVLKVGAKLQISNTIQYEIAEGDTLSLIAVAHGLSLNDLFKVKVAGDGEPVVKSKTILNFRETLRVLPFDYITQEGDTLQAVAARFDITMQLLSETPENGQISGLFKSDQFLNIPHLGQFNVAEILKDIQRTDGLKHLSGMASRYYLHGLRLPTDGIQPLQRGMWVRQAGTTLTLPQEAGLYALTGQQFPLPPLRKDKPLTISFQLQAIVEAGAPVRGGRWARFESSESPLQWQMVLDLNADGGASWHDAQRVMALQQFAAESNLDLELQHLGMEKPYKTIPTSYSLASPASWNFASEIPLPYGNKPEGVTSLKLWRLPEALLNVPDRSKHAVDPVFKMMLGQYDEASGEMNEREIGYYGWSTAIEFTVKKLSETGTSATAKTTYEILGTGTKEIVLLERLFKQPNRDTEVQFQQFILAFAADGNKQGIQTDIQGDTTMGIAKVNLSTDTKPPEAADFFRSRDLTTTRKATLLNKEFDFLQLLWEASITRAGGFFLYYYNKDTKEGLPDRLFNDKGEAKVTLIVLYQQPGEIALQNRLTGFMNAVITGESLDVSGSSVYAQADVRDEKISREIARANTLHKLAESYFANVGDIALANARTPIRQGINLKIEQGTFLVKPDGFAPGRTFAAIAEYLGVKAKVLRLVNQPLGRLDPDAELLPYTSLRIPTSTITIDNTETNLENLARKYGVSLASLAFDNQHLEGLFDNDLTIPSGPSIRSATIGVDQIALEARCGIPEESEVLDFPNADVGSDEFARTFLRHNFQLMRFRLMENLDFEGTVFGLPVGPSTVPGPDSDKEIWDYTVVVPYTRFLKSDGDSLDGALPDADASPYRGIDKVLQADFEWLDLYGNQVRTNLSNPDQASEIFNRPPLVTGYSDNLIGLAQWPSVSHNWSLAPTVNPEADFQLNVELRFDINRYRGMLSAMAVNERTIEILFSEPVNQLEARDPEKYALLGGIQIERVEVKPDGQTVVLHVDSLLHGFDYSLAVKRMPWASGGESPDGEALFHFPDIPKRRMTTLMKQAARERKVYENLWHQVNDPHGVEFSIETTLLEDREIKLDKEQQRKLIDEWLSAIYHFVQDRAKGQVRISAPPVVHWLDFPLTHKVLRQAQIYQLELFFTVRRLSDSIMGDFATTEAIKQISTQIHPTTGNTAENTGTKSLIGFATDFEKLASVDGIYQLKIATGIDRFELSTSRSGGKIWVIKLGLSKQSGDSILYRINNAGKPVIFAPRPISNKLESRDNVPIKRFEKDKGLVEDPTKIELTSFVNIDMDIWGRQLLDAVDYVLHPRFTGAIQIIDQKSGGTFLKDLIDNKQSLADIIQNWMTRIFKGESGGALAQAREVFRQRLLSRLSNAYNIHAALQFDATVQANIPDASTYKPQLYGNINFADANNSNTAKGNVTLSSSKLELSQSANQPFTVLLSAPGLVKGAEGEVLSSLDLDLEYQGTAIEHQIDNLPGIKDYKASSWLSFVIPTTVEPLKASLGEFKTPLVLRSYPESPEMIRQSQKNAPVRSNQLGQVKIWEYHFIYSRSFHYPQDRLHCRVEFNINEAEKDRGDLLDAFNQLAQFVTVYPEVKASMDLHLSKVDVDTEHEAEDFKVANHALTAFNTMMSNIVAAANVTTARSLTLNPSPRGFGGDDRLTYEFVIQEGVGNINGAEGMLYVRLEDGATGRPEGIGKPVISIEGCDSMEYSRAQGREEPDEPGVYYYWFRKDGAPLKAEEGQKIMDRVVVLPGMDIFQRQDAKSSVQLKRNEELIKDHPSEEPFVYTTGLIEFANAYHPTIDSQGVIEISALGTPGNQKLVRHLQDFWGALLENNTQPTLTVQVTCTYNHKINKALDSVKLPIFLQPPVSINVSTIENTGAGSLGQMIEEHWAAAIKKWYAKNSPKGEEGSIGFDLVVMSNLTRHPMPLLRLRNLRLLVSRTSDLELRVPV